MKTKTIIIIAFAFLILISGLFFIIPKPINQRGYETETLALNLDTPWAIDFLPDNGMIFTERSGRVSILEKGTIKIVGNIDVVEMGESGLLGIAVDPEFNTNKFVYLYYSTGQIRNKVSRFILNEKLENETILIDNIRGAQIHDGGRIKFGLMENCM